MSRANPWALSPAQAAARDDAILDQYTAALARSRKLHVSQAKADRWLAKQFAHEEVRRAVARAVERRIAAAIVIRQQPIVKMAEPLT